MSKRAGACCESAGCPALDVAAALSQNPTKACGALQKSTGACCRANGGRPTRRSAEEHGGVLLCLSCIAL